MPAPSSFAAWFTRPRLAAALLAVAALAAYANTFAVPFLFDDALSIPGNPTLRSLATAWFPPTDAGITVAGRPLLNFSFALNWAASGENVWSYHVVNLLIHVVNAWLLCAVVRRTLARIGHAEADAIALASALLWVVHPLGTAATTYIVQRAEALAAFWMLLALYAFARGWRAVAVAAAFAGVATKETAAVLPLLVLLYDRTFVAASFRQALRERSGFYAALAASWLLLAALVASTGQRGGSAGLGTVAWLPYALQQSEALVRYARLALWPDPLVFDYGTPLVQRASDVALPLLGVSAALVSTAVALWRAPRVGFLAAAVFLLLAPSSSLVPVATQTMAEHRAYLPLAAVVLGAALALWRWLTPVALPLSLALAATLGVATHLRNETYRDESALWRDTTEKVPANPRAWHNLGFALAQRGEFTAAVPHYRRAVELAPNYTDALNNLGNALLETGAAEEAVSTLEHAANSAPNDPEVRNSLGRARALAGDHARAAEEFRAAVRLAPNFALARSNLGQALAALGDTAGAQRELEEAVHLAPADPIFRNNVANLLASLGHPAEAVAHYQAALRLAPHDALTRFNYGNLLLHTGRLGEAIPHYEAALAARPDYVEAHVNLAVALQQLGRIGEAIAHYEAALRLRPGDPFAAENLRRLRAAGTSR